MNDYNPKPYYELDALILDALSGRSITFSALTVVPRIAECSSRLAKPYGHFDLKQPWRLVDRRLQALRKAGKIKVDRRTGWSRT